MIQFNYNPTITSNILKTEQEQLDNFFYQGHPVFLIPDFAEYPEDIWLSYLNFVETTNNCEVYSDDGGEITEIQVDESTGLTVCTYTAYDVQVNKSDEPQNVEVEITGYVTQDNNDYMFVATKVEIIE